MKFSDYLEDKGIVLKSWQMMAARQFLNMVGLHQQSATGKTFLMNVLRDFLNEHGNNFEL